MPINNNYDTTTDYDWSSMFNNTPLPLEEEPTAPGTAPAKGSLPAPLTTTAPASTTTGLDNLFSADAKSTLTTPATATTKNLENALEKSFATPVNTLSFMQVPDTTLHVDLLSADNSSYLCTKLAAGITDSTNNTFLNSNPGLSNSTLSYNSAANLSLSNPGNFSLNVSSYFNEFQSSPTSHKYFTNINFTKLYADSCLLPFLSPIAQLPPLYLDWHLAPLAPASSQDTTPTINQPAPEMPEEDEAEKIRKEQNNAVLLANLSNLDFNDDLLDQSTIAFIVKTFNNLTADRQQQMLNELTTTVFTAKIAERKTKLIILTRRYSNEAIVDNQAKGKGAVDDARSIIS